MRIYGCCFIRLGMNAQPHRIAILSPRNGEEDPSNTWDSLAAALRQMGHTVLAPGSLPLGGLRGFLRAKEPDVVLTTGTSTNLATLMAFWPERAPFRLVVHEDESVTRSSRVIRQAVSRLYRRADAIVADSDRTAATLLDWQQGNGPMPVVVPPVILPDGWQDMPAIEIRDRRLHTLPRPVLIAPATDDKQKLQDAFAAFRRGSPGSLVLLDGNLPVAFRQWAYRWADAAIVTSANPQGFCLEAMASRCPVIRLQDSLGTAAQVAAIQQGLYPSPHHLAHAAETALASTSAGVARQLLAVLFPDGVDAACKLPPLRYQGRHARSESPAGTSHTI